MQEVKLVCDKIQLPQRTRIECTKSGWEIWLEEQNKETSTRGKFFKERKNMRGYVKIKRKDQNKTAGKYENST